METSLRQSLQGTRMNKYLNSANIVTALTVTLYCSSTAYMGGYFSSFKGIPSLDSDILERNLHQVLYHGLELNFKFFLIIPLMIVVLFIAQYGYDTWDLRRQEKHQKFSTRELEAKHVPKIKSAYYLLSVLLTFMFLMVVFEHKGKQTALTLQDNIKNEKQVTLVDIPVGIKKKDKTLIFLFCGARNCSGLDIEHQSIVNFPQSNFTLHNGFVKNGKIQKGNKPTNSSSTQEKI